MSAVFQILFRKFNSERCINDLLRGKGILLITHHVQFLENANKILILRDGIEKISGTYSELVNEFNEIEAKAGVVDDIVFDDGSEERVKSIAATGYGTFSNNQVQEALAETKQEGRVKFALHAKYFSSGNTWRLGIPLLLLCILNQTILSGSDYWLKIWYFYSYHKARFLGPNKQEQFKSLILQLQGCG